MQRLHVSTANEEALEAHKAGLHWPDATSPCTEHTRALTFIQNLQAGKCRRLAANKSQWHWCVNEKFLNRLRTKKLRGKEWRHHPLPLPPTRKVGKKSPFFNKESIFGQKTIKSVWQTPHKLPCQHNCQARRPGCGRTEQNCTIHHWGNHVCLFFSLLIFSNLTT